MNYLEKKDLAKWLDAYDLKTYPPDIYEGLVFDDYKSNRKYEILGAWKTGCLRHNPEGTFFKDTEGYNYMVTDRWADHCPVGYDTWHYISDNAEKIEKEIPEELPSQMPEILKKLIERKGFGFFWAVFVAHSYKPKTYPLYDQHVYRAFKYLQSGGELNPATAPTDWAEYLNYCKFFNLQMSHAGVVQVDCDRALWAYGKFLKFKKKHTISSKTINEKSGFDNGAITNNNDRWVHSMTLGGKKKSFWWNIDEDCNLTISREFNHKTGNVKSVKSIPKDSITKLLKYLDGYKVFCLRNNVEKLRNNTEKKDGIGYFLYNNLKMTATDSQLASQIAAVFSYADVWANNGKTRDIEFWKNKSDEDWCKKVKHLYSALLNDY